MFVDFPEWRPDIADDYADYTKTATNVIPRGDGYGPWPAAAVFSWPALSGACRGIFMGVQTTGAVIIFVGTKTKLYYLSLTTGAKWTDAGTFTALAGGAQWSFAQFNNTVIAVQANNAPLSIDLTNLGTFATLGGTPPTAAYVTVVNRFLVLGGLTANPNRIQWSGLNSITTWDNVTLQSNFVDLPDGGIVTGMSGGDLGTVFQQRVIRRMTYAPGSPYTFQIDRLATNDGTLFPYSIVNAQDRIFYYSTEGFKVILPGGYPQPIGKERVDRTFAAALDSSHPELFMGVQDPNAQRVYFAFKSGAGSSPNLFDTIYVYDWVLDRWSQLNVTGECLGFAGIPALSLGLETVDVAFRDPFWTQIMGTVTALTGTTVTLTVNTGGNTATIPAGQGVYFFDGGSGALPTPFVFGTPYYTTATKTYSDGASITLSLAATGGVGAFAGNAITTTGGALGGTVYLLFADLDINTGWANNFSPTFLLQTNSTLPPFDSLTTATNPQLLVFDTAHTPSFFNGDNLSATLESAEYGSGTPRRLYSNGFYVIGDAPGLQGRISYRDVINGTSSQTAYNTVNAQGLVPQRQSARFMRASINVPAATTWNFVKGVEPVFSNEGEQ